MLYIYGFYENVPLWYHIHDVTKTLRMRFTEVTNIFLSKHFAYNFLCNVLNTATTYFSKILIHQKKVNGKHKTVLKSSILKKTHKLF